MTSQKGGKALRLSRLYPLLSNLPDWFKLAYLGLPLASGLGDKPYALCGLVCHAVLGLATAEFFGVWVLVGLMQGPAA